jgi:hypothetical protein
VPAAPVEAAVESQPKLAAKRPTAIHSKTLMPPAEKVESIACEARVVSVQAQIRMIRKRQRPSLSG